MAHDAQGSLNRLAVRATTHCLTGCAIGEVLGLVIGTALGFATLATLALAIGLAFFFGYALTMRPLIGAGMAFAAATKLALAADTLSITVMEITDNAILLVIPARWRQGSPIFSSGGAWPSPLASPGSWRSR